MFLKKNTLLRVREGSREFLKLGNEEATMQLDIEFTVPGIPRPQGSKSHFGNGIMVESSKFVANWRSLVSLASRDAMRGLQVARKPSVVAVTAEFYFDRPQSHYTKAGLRETAVTGHTSRPDVDKLLRAVLDAMTGIVFQDDSQVRIVGAAKYYGTMAQTRIRIQA